MCGKEGPLGNAQVWGYRGWRHQPSQQRAAQEVGELGKVKGERNVTAGRVQCCWSVMLPVALFSSTSHASPSHWHILEREPY